MYRLTARQILSVALLSAAFAAAGVACLDRWGSRFQPPTAAFTEADPSAEVAAVTDPSVATDERNNIEVFRAISPAVVAIHTTTRPRGFFDPGGQGSGSGSVIDEQGHILTNNHVVDDAASVSVGFGGDKTYPARLVGRDPDTDLAVIRVEGAPRELLRVVPMGDSDKLVVGQKVLAIGNPFGLDRTLTTGVISGLQRPIRAQNDRIIEGAIQTDASINPGNSGGPLLDSQGRMIGINSQILSPAGGSVGVGFAVPVNIAKRIVPQLIREGRVVRPKLGVYPRAVFDLRNIRLPVQEGLLILQLDPNGSAAQAGLRSVMQDDNGDFILGDIILSIDGEKTVEQNDLFRILDRHQFNDVVQVEVFRDGRRTTIPVRLLPEPQRRGVFRR
ncbi:MAG TPA: trypsin-like peptidase domain-containing protein [Pyrinomonadaceae bacterium]|nr:trypsin-like peptidase domain-containing protein [Pyrinomonadaceae bacterium]